MSRDDDYLWDRSGTPDPEVERLEKLLSPYAYREEEAGDANPGSGPPSVWRRRVPTWAAAAAILLVIAGGISAIGPRRLLHFAFGESGWQVTWMAGGGDDRLRVGEWLETPDGAEVRVAVAGIGRVDVSGNSRIRLKTTGINEHRMELARGKIDAFITAPPRLFFVETPAATAVDLGCAYSLEVDDEGEGELIVELGSVALEEGNFSTYVPAGAICRIRADGGPGIPWFEDADAAIAESVERLEQSPEDVDALESLLGAASREDTLSLFHLLPRLDRSARERVVAHVIESVPLPHGVTRDQVLALERDALEAWKRLLRSVW